jgi:hypothetical protein
VKLNAGNARKSRFLAVHSRNQPHLGIGGGRPRRRARRFADSGAGNVTDENRGNGQERGETPPLRGEGSHVEFQAHVIRREFSRKGPYGATSRQTKSFTLL